MFSLNYYSNPSVIYTGFSDRTMEYGTYCIKELNSRGISVYGELCYLVLKDGFYYLYCGGRELGFLSNKNDGTDVNFKRFVNSLYNDIGDFYCVAFPCFIEWFPFSNKYVVFKDKDSFSDIEKSISLYS